MGFSLGQTAQQAGYRLEAHESIGSTNAVALERASHGDPGRLWIVSKKQESGRGRRGRVWATSEGNLAATLLLAGDIDLGHAATLGFVAGLALGDALDLALPGSTIAIAADGGESPRSRFELKWPNDVMATGAKLAGILLESTMVGPRRAALAVGIGVNVVAHPDDTPYPATSLAAMGSALDAETLFAHLSEAWVENHATWLSPGGLARIRDRWLERAAGLGGEVAVKVDGEVRRGIFETIDEDCRFVMRDRDGQRIRIAAGDVHFGAVASALAAG